MEVLERTVLLSNEICSPADVVANWEKYTVKQDGDAIRRLIGTIGVSSPLSSIRKAFVSIRDAEEDSVRNVFGRGSIRL